MTLFERRLATGVIGVWLILGVCVSALRELPRLLHHQYLINLLAYECQWVLQAVAGAAFAVWLWRSSNKSQRIWRTLGVAAATFAASDLAQLISSSTLMGWWHRRPASWAMIIHQFVVIDVTHFFILALGVIAVVLMIERNLEDVRREREVAEIATAIADARARTVQMAVQPAEVRRALFDIEALLPDDPSAAENAVLNLSDVLREALLRIRKADAQ